MTEEKGQGFGIAELGRTERGERRRKLVTLLLSEIGLCWAWVV